MLSLSLLLARDEKKDLTESAVTVPLPFRRDYDPWMHPQSKTPGRRSAGYGNTPAHSPLPPARAGTAEQSMLQEIPGGRSQEQAKRENSIDYSDVSNDLCKSHMTCASFHD